jgi:hypothetical protein
MTVTTALLLKRKNIERKNLPVSTVMRGLHGSVWFCMVLHGSAWFCMVCRVCMVLHDLQ